MRVPAGLLLLLCAALVGQSMAQQATVPQKAVDSLSQKFLSDFNLRDAAHKADVRLQHNPSDIEALVVRMETAELEAHPEIVLDTALRLCTMPAENEIQEIASNRILQHAGNTRVFNSVLRRIKAVAALNNSCSLNLKLALVASASDGNPKLDLDDTARSAGLLTHWRIAGPFGQYSNVDFERSWQPERDQLSQGQYSNDGVSLTKKKGPADASHTLLTERFWFRDGMLTLPEYLSGSGIFYAASEAEIPNTQVSEIEILSAGTYAVFVDGKQAVLHDTREMAGASRTSTALRLGPGRHRILVKFTADTAPLSIALHAKSSAERRTNVLPKALERYTSELIAYFRGDFIGTERMLSADPDKGASTAQYLQALLYSAAEEHSPRAHAAWKALAQAHPSALMARLKADESAAMHGQNEDALQDATSILAKRSESEAALQLAFSLSRAQSGAPALLTRLLEVHPSCANLTEAVKFYSAAGEQDKAAKAEQQLPSCAPESLQYARVLSESGRHGAAAAYLQQLITKNPLHRAARRMLIEQLVLSGQQSAALLQARQLHDLAPGASSYLLLAQNPAAVQDSRSERARGFIQGKEFYAPYRRDGLELVRNSAQRKFSGGAVVILLSDKVIHVGREGQAAVYVHRITRPLNKDGISRYGEVSLPHDADLLELRTIKASGQVIEPELSQQKPTISMPALEPGDAIEEEYVLPYSQLELAPESALGLTFVSFDAPILYSRLILLSPAGNKLNIREHAGAPQPLVGQDNETVVRIWQRDNIAQTVAEPYSPSVDLLPAVTVAAAKKPLDHLRDQLMDATRIGLHVEEAAQELHFAQTASGTEKARQLYRFVTTKLDSTGPDWTGSPAEDTLQSGQGSRTATLLALARAAGLKAGLLLAHKVSLACSSQGDLSCYSEPLVRFWFADGGIFDVDAEADDLPFGVISPALKTNDALLVPLIAEDTKKPQITELATGQSAEKTSAEAQIKFEHDDLVADLHIRLGAARAQEIRSLLRNAGERQPFFEQLALRIFSGATAIMGSSAHEDDPEQPLEISIHCIVPQFITRQNGHLDFDQLTPALGLRAQYGKASTRKFPLYIESLFFESTIFRINLPENVQVISLPKDFDEKREFGEYSVRFVRSAQKIEIHRDFHIPVQVITPEKYAAFAEFARHIDDAERQRISLELGKDASAQHQYRLPPATGMFR